MLSRKLTGSIAIVTSAIAVGGGAYGIASATSGSSSAVAGAIPTAVAGTMPTANAQPNARSGPAAGGSSGTVGGVSRSGFTLTTSAGQKVTVDEVSSTKYRQGASSASASVVAKGKRVLVLGTTTGTTITATQVIVQASGSGGSAASSTAMVVPFKRGAPSTAKKVGRIPANFTQGSGTIVAGTAATKATEAALAAYPGGVVNRVVKLGNGDYNVHYIGVNWPHHIFVNQTYKVIGAE
jgi:hypothetical protein